MKFLLIPGNNSLSHIGKCAALASELSARGHTVLTAVSGKYVDFLRLIGLPHAVLPDIQESDDGSLPSLAWFRSHRRLVACIQSEVELIESFRPDRVIGVFRFTLKVSAALLGVPYDAVACGCMMPDVTEILGYEVGEAGAADQALFLKNFFRYAGKRMGMAMQSLGLAPLWDMRDFLIGDRTFLWDYPQFMPLPKMADRHHIGPIFWTRWPDLSGAPETFPEKTRPLALVSLGTRQACRPVVLKIVHCLIKSGFNVLVACGGHPALMHILPGESHLRCWRFAPVGELLRQAQLLVCHGGQMTIFEALMQQVPVLVVPFHPEQAHNGLCVERIKCGRRLLPPTAFKGDLQAYADTFAGQSDADIIQTIEQIVCDQSIAEGLRQAQNVLRSYDAPVMMADFLERA